MSQLSPLNLTIFALSPLVVTAGLLWCIAWFRIRKGGAGMDGPRRLLAAAVRLMPESRRDWGEAMLAEIGQCGDRSARWRFALGCARVALFPPVPVSGPRSWLQAFRRLEPKCGALSVALPPLGVPLLVCAGFAAQNFTRHDHFFNGELVPGLVGAFIVGSFACILAGVPLGLAGVLRLERLRWLSLAGPALSIAILGYVMIVQHLASALP